MIVALLLAGLPSLVYVLALNAIDRFEKEPLKVIVATVLLGAVATPAISAAVLLALGRGPGIPLGYSVGSQPDPVARIVEQVVAGLLLLLLARFLGNEFDDALDGIVYGGAIGAGLGATETFLYATGGLELLGTGTLVALAITGLNQAFYGAILGAIVGGGRRIQPRWVAGLVVGLGVGTAALLSSLHDVLPVMLSRLVGHEGAGIGALTRAVAALVNVLGFAALGLAIWGAWRREARIVRAYLRREIPGGSASEEDIARLTAVRSRFSGQLRALTSGRLSELQRIRRLEAAQGELAFHNWRVDVRRRPPPSDQGDRLRARIRQLKAELAEGRRAP